MQNKGGIFIPDELIHAFVTAVLLIGALFVAGCAAYYLWRGLRRTVNWFRMSKIERAKAYLRKHDAEFSRDEQMQGLMRPLNIGVSRQSRTELPKLFRRKA